MFNYISSKYFLKTFFQYIFITFITIYIFNIFLPVSLHKSYISHPLFKSDTSKKKIFGKSQRNVFLIYESAKEE